MAHGPHPAPTTGQVVVIEAAPTPISIDTARTAVLVIDMQNDFGAKGGMFDRAGIDIAALLRRTGFVEERSQPHMRLGGSHPRFYIQLYGLTNFALG